MTDTETLKAEMNFLRRSLINGSSEIATDCWPENMQAVSDLANEMRYQTEFGLNKRGKVPVMLTPRPKPNKPNGNG